ncbi:MAG: multifunctional oxoglutarate decarboxylase/oxoglutarate dehydrogenase thiamine pyrophosphate-binding subunit/dihydrolipoyllysine-residue succinyltransferase subunit [Actinomycetia bacterium]|nr:multifunctional oxoglutarate decarboxylase/oxoglutarate dehydrogenase thiamine pyrophosphate-binding subunit/dihydrolipoyllysine-residue succinyltransferase subunit [Actinomycetes bacterium]
MAKPPLTMNEIFLPDFGDNSWLVAQMRDRYLADPAGVPPRWAAFFAGRPDLLQVEDPPADPAPAPSDPKPAPSDPEPAPIALVDDPPPAGVPDVADVPEAGTAPDILAADAITLPPVGADATNPVATVEHRERRDEAPSTPGEAGGLSADIPNPLIRPEQTAEGPTLVKLRGVALRTAQNMAASLHVPTATSYRDVPMKLAIDQRAAINNFLRRSRGGKVSFTQLIAWAMVQALQDIPAMNVAYAEPDGVPCLVQHHGVNLGVAIDLTASDGTHQLVVPVIRDCQDLNFSQFWAAYEDLLGRARAGQLTVADYQGATCSITNPGSIGTTASRPRLMPGQSVILGAGAIAYPAPFAGASSHTMADLGVSKVTTLSSTYDHRVIQGAHSGMFLGRISDLLLGASGFYDRIFLSLRIPYPPLTWSQDISTARSNQTSRQARIAGLVQAYRQFGHLMADIDPLEYRQRTHPDLELETHGLTLWDLDRQFPVWNVGGRTGDILPLRDIIDILRDSYCHTIGIEYQHIQDPEQRAWWQAHVERPHTPRPRTEQLRILDMLSEAEVFETFLQTKYVGQTRFSLEGAESAIVVLAQLCESAADHAFAEVCIGMPHRGRLNVLANIAGKLYSQIFREFDNRAPESEMISGDVKYHLGAEGNYTAASGASVNVSVAANPSHLEAVSPVLEGIARAKIDRLADPSSFAVLPVLMHGDASFAGQGVVYETLQMSQLRAYRTGGTIHVVVNNQVGFTTPPDEARSSVYSTDVAKAVQAPVLHVNGDDPDACARVAALAFAFRQRFHKDVVIDMVCYRRRGHNEGDDPSLTQPQMYDLIEQKRPVRKIFTEALVGRGDISLEDAEQAVNRFRDRLEQVFANVRDPNVPREPDEYRIAPRYPDKPRAKAAPAISREMMSVIAGVYGNLPDGFHVHPKAAPQLARRADAIINGPIDWATAELLAIGSLLMEHHPVRLVGQDTRRGTFSQRFGSVVDRVTNEHWVPLKHLTNDQAPFDIFNSLLSEYAAMGFEYGYSLAAPEALVCWEAQYGDFANGAQTITDEFVVGGATKWGQQSGVVLLLPHGYEGAGPDHSSARLERFLQLCSDDNMTVAQPSTPASYFHLLRTHVLVDWHQPLIVATPKSMLRNKMALCSPDDFIHGTWHPALPDPSIDDPARVTRVTLCSGKMRWDLMAERERQGLQDEVAIISLERLYPLPDEGLARALAPYLNATDFRWVQDEPANQGAWEFLRLHLPGAMSSRLGRAFALRGYTRPASEVPSVGSGPVNAAQQKALLAAALRPS